MLLLSKLKFLFMSFTCVVETQMPEDFWYSCGLFYSSLVSCYLCVEKKRLLATLSSRISFFKSPTCEKKCITCERSFLNCVRLDTNKKMFFQFFKNKTKIHKNKQPQKKQKYIAPRLRQTQNYLKITYLGGR